MMTIPFTRVLCSQTDNVTNQPEMGVLSHTPLPGATHRSQEHLSVHKFYDAVLIGDSKSLKLNVLRWIRIGTTYSCEVLHMGSSDGWGGRQRGGEGQGT